ncbi:MAG: hypothetical protein UU95_C0012G0007 [Parcubacteria group bacterium GW2011_GWC2_42_12]|nr:MAG: hypothetical protein UU95_C0012G0007 [Parcubacteria group bacterium GW2011_GWC2_42_12]
MFIQTKIRGLPLHALAQSGLFPQINLLAQLWKESGCGKNNQGNYNNPIKQAEPKIWLAIVIWLSWMGGIFIFFVGQGQEDASKAGLFLFWLGWFFFLIDALIQPWNFASSVRRLDECLKQQDSKGIAILPHTTTELDAFLRNYMESWAWSVLFYEDKFGRDSDEAERWRARRRNLRAIAEEFGFDLGKDDLYYEKATTRFVREKAEKAALG